jgi:hypothetical protein
LRRVIAIDEVGRERVDSRLKRIREHLKALQLVAPVLHAAGPIRLVLGASGIGFAAAAGAPGVAFAGVVAESVTGVAVDGGRCPWRCRASNRYW